MTKFFIFNRQKFAEFLFYILCIFLIILISGCSENTSPTASITSPSDGSTYNEGDSITFEGSGTDTEDGNLTGSSLVWASSIDGEIGTGDYFTLNSLSEGTHTITLTAFDSDGTAGSASIEITIGNTPPTASITSPGEPDVIQEYNEGDSITFEGSGTDTEDGNLTGSSLVWISSIDVEIGTGDYFTLNSLSEGTHTITLIAIDSQGAMGSDSVQIKINPL